MTWSHVCRPRHARCAAQRRVRSRCITSGGSKTCGAARSRHGSRQHGGARRWSCAAPATASFMAVAERRAEQRAVCIERCMHGSEGGVGASLPEAFRAYPTKIVVIIAVVTVTAPFIGAQVLA